jgi:hypothetical protein
MRIEKLLISTVLLAFSGIANSEVFVYYGPDNAQAQADYLAALDALAANATITKTITEGFEDNIVWADSRTSIPSSGGTPSTTCQGLIWKSNFANSLTGTGAALDGSYGFYSIPHGNTYDGGRSNCEEFDGEFADFDDPCWQGDGWVVTSAAGETLYGIGGWIDPLTTAKVTFLLDGVNVNEGRDGEVISGWTFVGVIDTAGFTSVEIRELGGTDGQPKLIFGDSFTVGVSAVPVPAGDLVRDGQLNAADLLIMYRMVLDQLPPDLAGDLYPPGGGDNVINLSDLLLLQQLVLQGAVP